MILAHAAAGGPSLELLVLAAALLFLGVVFFVQKSTKPQVAAALILGAVVVGGGSFALDRAERGAAIEIVSPEDGAHLPDGRRVELEVRVEGSSGAPRYRVLVDGKHRATASTPTTELDLESGRHTIAVELTGAVDPGHRVADEISVTVR